jgi:hypothetical protein
LILVPHRPKTTARNGGRSSRAQTVNVGMYASQLNND